MANGMGVQFIVFLVPAAIIVYLLVMMKTRKAHPPASAAAELPPAVEKPQSVQPVRVEQPTQFAQPEPVQTIPPPIPAAASRQMPAESSLETATANPKPNEVSATAVATPSAVVPARIDMEGLAAASEDRRDQILATISQNIRKSLPARQPIQSSPIRYSETKTRTTEYVRVKTEIITPHDQVRFSILKDAVSTNMLAIFRRASFDWQTPDDLIALLPGYLAAEAEILNGQVLLIGTRGISEKLAVPIRALDAESGLRECFDFVTDVRTVTNTPAVLRTSDTEFKLVSKGVITRALFTNAIEQGEPLEMKLLADGPSDESQKNYTATLRPIDSAVPAAVPQLEKYRSESSSQGFNPTSISNCPAVPTRS
jgi:hypothetical protein